MTERDLFAGAARYDLFLELTRGEDGTTCRFEYRTALFDATGIAELADRWEAAVTAFRGGAR